jgi:hypothetical protein
VPDHDAAAREDRPLRAQQNSLLGMMNAVDRSYWSGAKFYFPRTLAHQEK